MSLIYVHDKEAAKPADNKQTTKPTPNNKPAPMTGDCSPFILFFALAFVCVSAISVSEKKKSY